MLLSASKPLLAISKENRWEREKCGFLGVGGVLILFFLAFSVMNLTFSVKEKEIMVGDSLGVINHMKTLKTVMDRNYWFGKYVLDLTSPKIDGRAWIEDTGKISPDKSKFDLDSYPEHPCRQASYLTYYLTQRLLLEERMNTAIDYVPEKVASPSSYGTYFTKGDDFIKAWNENKEKDGNMWILLGITADHIMSIERVSGKGEESMWVIYQSWVAAWALDWWLTPDLQLDGTTQVYTQNTWEIWGYGGRWKAPWMKYSISDKEKYDDCKELSNDDLGQIMRCIQRNIANDARKNYGGLNEICDSQMTEFITRVSYLTKVFEEGVWSALRTKILEEECKGSEKQERGTKKTPIPSPQKCKTYLNFDEDRWEKFVKKAAKKKTSINPNLPGRMIPLLDKVLAEKKVMTWDNSRVLKFDDFSVSKFVGMEMIDFPTILGKAQHTVQDVHATWYRYKSKTGEAVDLPDIPTAQEKIFGSLIKEWKTTKQAEWDTADLWPRKLSPMC